MGTRKAADGRPEPPLDRPAWPWRLVAVGVVSAASVAGAWLSSASRDAASVPTRLALGTGEHIDAGITLYHVKTAAEQPSPLAIRALALDPARVELTTALARGRAQGRGHVVDAVSREGWVAGVNAGFFMLETGDPSGVLRVDGDLVSDARLLRGAVAIRSTAAGMRLAFNRARVRVSVDVWTGSGWQSVALDGVDTVRRAGGATLYTSRFGPRAPTPSIGIEWPLTLTPGVPGTPGTTEGALPVPGMVTNAKKGRRSVDRATALSASEATAGLGVPGTVKNGRVGGRRVGGGSEIPMDGAVLSFGGRAPPAPLDRLRAGTPIRLREEWTLESTADAADFVSADDIVGGAGLLVLDGRAITDWGVEQASESLRTLRHPRTLIGTDARGTIWLVTIDGRQPAHSVGLTLDELRQLALDLGLTNALNLDGGGSTTMVVRGAIVNRPSDAIGPRAVSDVLLVRPRRVPPPAGAR